MHIDTGQFEFTDAGRGTQAEEVASTRHQISPMC